MNPKTKKILLITAISILLASGILMIIIPCIIVGNWWPLLSIFVFASSFIFPVMCNACSMQKEHDYLFDDSGQSELGGTLAWLLAGIFITVGYAIPFELWRTKTMLLVEFLLTGGGGTVILVALLLFQFVVVP
jgi:hypothetical protein